MKGSEILGQHLLAEAEYQIKIYDFKRPDKFSKDQIRTVSIMHETFARLTTTSLSAQLRSLVAVHVASVDQLTYEEFIRSIPNPTTLAVIDMDPLKGSAILEIDPAITFSIIDRLFGGQGEGAKFSRELTDIEQSVMEGIIVRVLGNLRESWSTVIDLRPRLGGIETNPMFAQIVPPQEMVVLVTLETKVGEVEGMVNLCLPYLTIEPIISKLSAQYWYSSPQRDSTGTGVPAAVLESLPVESLVFAETEQLSLRELAQLRPGRRIRLPRFAGGEAFLSAGSQPVVRLQRMPAPRRPGGRAGGRLAFAVEPSPARSPSPPDGPQELVRQVQEALERLGREVRQQLPEKRAPAGPRPEPAGYPTFGDIDAAAEAEGAASRSPFGFIGTADVDFLAALAAQEHPQTVAMILSHLESNVAAHILARLPETMRVEVIARVATMDRVPPDVLKEVERVVEAKIRSAGTDRLSNSGGAETAAGILDLSGCSVEQQVLEALGSRDPALAEEIRSRRFGFDDLALLGPEERRAVLKHVERRDVLLALRAAGERVREAVLESYGEAERSRLQRDRGEGGRDGGRVRLNEVEAAQRRIANVMRQLADTGAIRPPRGP